MEGMGKKIIIFVVLIILIIGLVNVLFRFVLPIKPVKMISRSMAPTYNKGDVLFYSSSDTYNIEDIIIYTPSARPQNIVARIIEENPDGTFKVKGDANPSVLPIFDQESLKKEQIVGKVLSGTKWFIFYPLIYIIQIIIALLLTKLIYSKLIKEKTPAP